MSNDTRSPAEIERDLERNRVRIDSTISALQDRFSLGEVVDQVVGYARNGPGEFGRNFGVAVRDNPLPVALIGIGIGWLALGGGPSAGRIRAAGNGNAIQQPDDLGPQIEGDDGMPPYRPSYQSAQHWSSADDAERTTLGDRLERTKNSVAGVSRKVGESVSDFVERLYSTKASSMGMERNEGETSEDFSTRVDNAVSAASERFATLQTSARQRASRLGARAGDARDQATDFFKDQPLVVAGISVAIGAALAAALPSTRREDELLGEHRDRLRDDAAEAVGKAAERAEEVGHTAVETAGQRLDVGASQADDAEQADRKGQARSAKAHETGT